MGDETNGDNKSRLDGIEEILRVLVNEHAQFHEEHGQLLKAQVLLYDSVQKLTDNLALVTAAQQHADERMAALIVVVDDLIRRPPNKN
jgi:metal-responsive CopG/Arc/MetJ family transcriptional regulator